MALSYIDALGLGFPEVRCHVVGDPNNYDNLVWEGGAPLPKQTTLDEWIAANPDGLKPTQLTKFEFRKLFTLNERVAIDNAETNESIPANYRKVVVTVLKDLELSGIVNLDLPDVISGVTFMETLGLLAPGRAARILSNNPPV